MTLTSKTPPKIKFLCPFPGKPTAIPLTGLFLFSPTVIWALSGISMSGIFKHLGHESLYKRFNAVVKEGKKLPESKLRKLFDEMSDAFEMPPEITREFSAVLEEEFLKENDESPDTEKFFNEIGFYQAAITGENLSAGRKYPTIYQTFLLELEQASARSEKLLAEELFTEAIQEIKNNELLAQFLWPEALFALERANSFSKFVLLRALVTLEVHLSYLTVLERFYEMQYRPDDLRGLLSVLPSLEAPSKNPTALLFEWVKEQAGVKTMKTFLNHPKLVSIDMEMVSLKRWSCGSHHPDREWLVTLVGALFDDENYAPFWVRHEFVKTLNFIGYFHQSVSSKIDPDPTEAQMAFLAPWPDFPHNYPDFASWGRVRYEFWREYAYDYEMKHRYSQA